MIAALGKHLPALVVALVGVVVAWAWYQNFVIGALAVVVLVAVGVAAWIARRRGARLLSGLTRDPVKAVPLLEVGAGVELAAGALAAGLLIAAAVGVANATGEGTAEVQKQLVTAAAGAVTTFIAAVFVKNVEDFGGLMASPVQSEFQAAYEGCFASGSHEWRAVYDPNFGGEEGWGSREVRRSRADAVAGKPCTTQAP